MSRIPTARRYDLHLHSDQSDGRYGAEEVLARCAASGLEVVALTDHDLVASIEPGPREVDGRRIHVLAGAELTGTHAGREYHLLVYFPGDAPAGFVDFCQERARARATRYDVARGRLELSNLPAPDADARNGHRALTRLHLARALVKAGHASSVSEAFRRYLNDVKTVPNADLPFVDVIRVARGYGGLTSWAHPPRPAVEAHVETFAQAGLQGLEGVRPQVPSKASGFYKKVARRLGLYLTGGSDWHGWSDGNVGLFTVEPGRIDGFLTALAA